MPRLGTSTSQQIASVSPARSPARSAWNAARSAAASRSAVRHPIKQTSQRFRHAIETLVVPEALEDRDCLLGRSLHPVRHSLGRVHHEEGELGEACSDLHPFIACASARIERLVERSRCSLPVAAQCVCSTEPHEELRAHRVIGFQQIHRACEQVARRRHVASIHRSIAARGETSRTLGGKLATALVNRPEFRSEPIRLLEVVGEHLLELDDVLPGTPSSHAAYRSWQLGARRLRHALVRGVADQCVPEPEGLAPAEDGSSGPIRSRRTRARRCRDTSSRGEVGATTR